MRIYFFKDMNCIKKSFKHIFVSIFVLFRHKNENIRGHTLSLHVRHAIAKSTQLYFIF